MFQGADVNIEGFGYDATHEEYPDCVSASANFLGEGGPSNGICGCNLSTISREDDGSTLDSSEKRRIDRLIDFFECSINAECSSEGNPHEVRDVVSGMHNFSAISKFIDESTSLEAKGPVHSGPDTR